MIWFWQRLWAIPYTADNAKLPEATNFQGKMIGKVVLWPFSSCKNQLLLFLWFYIFQTLHFSLSLITFHSINSNWFCDELSWHILKFLVTFCDPMKANRLSLYKYMLDLLHHSSATDKNAEAWGWRRGDKGKKKVTLAYKDHLTFQHMVHWNS